MRPTGEKAVEESEPAQLDYVYRDGAYVLFDDSIRRQSRTYLSAD